MDAQEPEPELPEGIPPEPEPAEPDPHTFLDFAKAYDWRQVENTLTAHPELINTQPCGRWSALHQAAQAQDINAVQMLLKFKADPFVKTHDGQTPRDVCDDAEVKLMLEQAERDFQRQRRRRQQAPPAEIPRTFTQQFAKAVEISPIVGERSAPYTRGLVLTEILHGLEQTKDDKDAVKHYGAAETARHFQQLCELLQRDLPSPSHPQALADAEAAPAPLQLQKNVIAAYTAETYFGGHGHSVLNTKLRNLQEYPSLEPAAQLLHHSVSELAQSDEYGYDGEVFRAMRLTAEVIAQYVVHRDTKLNVFSWSGFTSCTRDAATCLGFVDDWELNVIFRIQSGGRRLRPMKIEEWSQIPEEKEVLYDLGQQFELMAVDHTTRTQAAERLGAVPATATPASATADATEKAVVIITLKAVDRFHELVLDVFKDDGDIGEALRVCQLRTDRDIRECGEQSVEAADSFGSLAIVYQSQGDYAKALDYYEKALSIKLKALGQEHLITKLIQRNIQRCVDAQRKAGQ